MTFGDYFSAVSAGYAEFRPRYPEALFDWIASHCPHRRLAWDCATGSGQAAAGLAGRFDRVIATDASATQLSHAMPHPRIEYRVARAEASGLAAASADLVTVAQALHWLSLDRFFAEVRRVLRPDGFFAAWGYGLTSISAEIDPIVAHFYTAVVGPFWPWERVIVDEEYRTVPFPFAEVPAPRFTIERLMTLEQFIGYVGTWSAVRRYIAANGDNPVGPVRDALLPLWGPPGETRPVSWPVFVRAGRP